MRKLEDIIYELNLAYHTLESYNIGYPHTKKEYKETEILIKKLKQEKAKKGSN